MTKTLKSRIREDEGFSATPYVDAHGFSIGYGHFLGNGVFKINRNIAEKLLEEDIHRSMFEEMSLGYGFLSDVRHEVLIEMIFNLGFSRFRTFKKMLAALEKQDFETAADEMLDSRWARQVKGRAIRLAEAMRNDKI